MKQIKTFLGLVTLLLLFSCSVSTEFFIQNLTSSKQTVTINFRKNIFSNLKNGDDIRVGFTYENRIVKPGEFRKSKNLKYMEKAVVNESITFEIPANSTLRIEKSDNFDLKSTVKNVKINDKKYLIEDLFKKAEKIKYNYIYKIEES